MAEYIERGMTCGDCIHADVCERVSSLTEFSRENPAYCKQFKNSADFVRVVRCRDCKWFRRNEPYSLNGCARNGGVAYEDENHYCYYGERR